MRTDNNNQKYFVAPKRLISHLRLFTESDLKTYLGILSLLDKETNKAQLTLTALADLVGISVRSVNKSVLRLRAFGYIRYNPVHGAKDKSTFESIAYPFEKKTNQEKSKVSIRKDHTFPDSGSKNQLTLEENNKPSFQTTSPNVNNSNTVTGIKKTLGKERDIKGEKTPYRIPIRKSMKFLVKTKEEQLAHKVAEKLNAHDSMPLLVMYCQKYSKPVVKQALAEVETVPPEKIKKSRLALFIHLLHKYADKSNHAQKDQSPGH